MRRPLSSPSCAHPPHAQVFQVMHRATGQVYAMKVMRKDRIVAKDHGEYVRAERDVLTSVVHPYIVTLRFSFQVRTLAGMRWCQSCAGAAKGWRRGAGGLGGEGQSPVCLHKLEETSGLSVVGVVQGHKASHHGIRLLSNGVVNLLCYLAADHRHCHLSITTPQTPNRLYLVLDFINGGHLFFNLYRQVRQYSGAQQQHSSVQRQVAGGAVRSGRVAVSCLDGVKAMFSPKRMG